MIVFYSKSIVNQKIIRNAEYNTTLYERKSVIVFDEVQQCPKARQAIKYLVAAGNKLFYYTWAKDEKHNYEIDFLLSRRNKLCPIEVKSSGYSAHVSLDAFAKKFSSRIDTPYLIYTKDLRRDASVVLLPAYLTQLLK